MMEVKLGDASAIERLICSLSSIGLELLPTATLCYAQQCIFFVLADALVTHIGQDEYYSFNLSILCFMIKLYLN